MADIEDVPNEEIPPAEFSAEVQAQDLPRYQLDARDVINTIRLHLSGYYYDPFKEKWVKNEEYAMLNEKGVNAILKIVAATLHKVIFLSNLSREKIEKLSQEVHKQTAKLLFENYEEYGVREPRYIPIISLIAGMNVFAALKRAEDGRTAENIIEVQHTIERIVSRSNKSFLPWGGGD